MKRSMISSLTLAAAMLVSTGAWAQTMVGQQTVSAEDLPKVQAQCNTLAGVDAQSMASDTTTAEGGTEAPADGAGDLGKDSETPNGTDAATATVDLSLITIEDCKAAGLAK
jgi:hypothetical protein